MKYSFFSSVCAWLPSALMMAVSASGASSAPFASFVKYVPEEVKNKPVSGQNKCQTAPRRVFCCPRREAHLKTTSVMLHNSYAGVIGGRGGTGYGNTDNHGCGVVLK